LSQFESPNTTSPDGQSAGANALEPSAPDKPQADRREVDTCWHRIGVYGDGKCPELVQHVHCRNCPVFSSAAHRLLDRPLPEEYRREWTAHFAEVERRTPPAKSSAVLFRIDAEWLALPAQAFQEIAERRRIHSLPHRRQGIVIGLVNIRGELLICVTLSRLLGLERNSQRKALISGYDRLLVANWEGSRLVFPVDEVQGIHRLQATELREPPATVAKSNLSFTQGIFLWQKKAVGFLDPALLFSALNRSLT
jgi:chemotaxis-related protein WspD